MKKKFIYVLMLAGVMGLLAGCGKESDGEESKGTESSAQELEVILKDINVEEIVTLGDYKGLKVQVAEKEVTDAEVEAEVDEFYISALPYMTGVEVEDGRVDRAVANGDLINIDYEGKKDGVAFSGGTSAGSYLLIGSGMFINGFEEGLIGAMPGETRELNLTFPENYGTADLAGASVVFTVTVNYVLPGKYNDTLIEEIGIPDVTTYQELKDYYRDYMNSQIQSQIRDKVLKALVDSSEFKDLPEYLVEKYRSIARQNIESTAALYGVDGDTYCYYYYGTSLEALLNDISATVKENVALQAVANKENMNISDEELQKKALEAANQAGYDTIEEYIGATSLEDYREYLMLNNVTDFLVENAVVETEGN